MINNEKESSRRIFIHSNKIYEKITLINDGEDELKLFLEEYRTKKYKNYRRIDKDRKIKNKETAEKFLRTMASEIMFLYCYQESLDTLIKNATLHRQEMLFAWGFFFSSFHALYDAIELCHARLSDKKSKIGNIDKLLWFLEYNIYKNIALGKCCIMEKIKIESLRVRYNNFKDYLYKLKERRDTFIAHNDNEKSFIEITQKKYDKAHKELLELYVDIMNFCILFFDGFSVQNCFTLFDNENILRECCTVVDNKKFPGPIEIDGMLDFVQEGYKNNEIKMQKQINDIIENKQK